MTIVQTADYLTVEEDDRRELGGYDDASGR